MQLPSEKSSSEVLINFAIYTSIRVAVKPETSQLSVPLTEATQTLETKNALRKKKAKESASMMAMRDEKNDNFDGSIIFLSLELLSVTGNNRDDVRYKYLFSKTPSSITSAPIKDKLADAKVLIQKLTSNGADEIYVKHLALIQTAVAVLEEAMHNYETALINEKSCFDFEKSAQAALRNTLVKTYGKLIELKGKKEAEKYFKKHPQKGKKIQSKPQHQLNHDG